MVAEVGEGSTRCIPRRVAAAFSRRTRILFYSSILFFSKLKMISGRKARKKRKDKTYSSDVKPGRLMGLCSKLNGSDYEEDEVV